MKVEISELRGLAGRVDQAGRRLSCAFQSDRASRIAIIALNAVALRWLETWALRLAFLGAVTQAAIGLDGNWLRPFGFCIGAISIW